jgi:Ca-activated chloride channel homolog
MYVRPRHSVELKSGRNHRRQYPRQIGLFLVVPLTCWGGLLLRGSENVAAENAQAALERDVTQGALRVAKPDGTIVECPLKHTDVQAEISGFIARVRLKQTFHNPLKEKIEAVYVFPLPHQSAVDAMNMRVGEREIVGVIKRRDDARQIYEQALLAGQTAALLEQERPNIFTQSVGNIAPGQEVLIEISYVDVLDYDLGSYEFRFPMVVGPRYNPGSAVSSPAPLPPELKGKTSPTTPDTTHVPDASRINPPVLKPNHRNGHDISLSLTLDAGVPVQDLTVPNHRADVKRTGDQHAKIALSPDDQLPNKEFVLRYKVTGQKPEIALLAHTDATAPDVARAGSGYFMLMIQPKEDARLTKSPPREMVFLVDVSGSMSGLPTAKVIDAMQNMLKLCRPIDTVQVVTFAGDAHKLFEKPVAVNPANIGRALNFTQGLQGSGGTEMLKGVKMAIDEPLDKERLRIVVMLTDGYIGNEAEIIEHVGKECGDRIRFWCIGIGSSPNMFLIDGVARQGGGMGRTLGLEDDAASLTQEIMTRVQRAQLAKVRIDYGGLQVSQTYPTKLPELWAGRPVIVYGRYTGSGDAQLTVSGEVEGEPATWQLTAHAPNDEPAHDVLASVWARQKIEDLVQQTYYQGSPAVEEEVTGLALQYRLMSPYTSFVAVDQQSQPSSEPARPPRRMLVPIPLPEGTRWEGFFGPEAEMFGDAEAGVVSLGLMPAKDGGRYAGRLAMDKLAKNESKADAFFYRAKSPTTRLSSAAAPAQPLPLLRSSLSEARAGRRGGQSYSRGAMAGGVANGHFGGVVLSKRALAVGKPVADEKTKSLKQLSTVLEREEQLAAPATPAELSRQSSMAMLLAEQTEPLAKAAQAALDAGREAQKAARLANAKSDCTLAWFLATAAGADTVAAEALDAIEAIHRTQLQAAIKGQPQLAKRLDLVIRDQTFEAALNAIAKATGIKVNLLPGSLDDARTISGDRDVHVNFLDLRGATAGEALDWLLLPARIEWWLDGDAITAGTARRGPGTAAWVYDVTSMALPTDDELKGNDEQNVARVKQALQDFIAAVRKQLGADMTSAAWFAPGELLVTGDAATHELARSLLAGLADAKAKVPAGVADLQKLTAKRATARRADDEKYAAARHRNMVAMAHEQFGWQLLAAAASGQLDLEALSELQAAWKQPETKELLAGPTKALLFRSLWAVAESARSLPDEPELSNLAETAIKLCQPAFVDAEETLRKSPDDAAAFLAMLYATLAQRDRSQIVASRLELLTSPSGQSAELQVGRTLARALLAQTTDADRNALAELARGQASGEDMVVLTAFACRRTAGETWRTFRGESKRLLGSQPLAGNVIVLVNRLDGLPLK